MSQSAFEAAIKLCNNFLKIYLTEMSIISAEETRIFNDVVDAVSYFLSFF